MDQPKRLRRIPVGVSVCALAAGALAAVTPAPAAADPPAAPRFLAATDLGRAYVGGRGGAGHVATADFDGDGHPDLVFTEVKNAQPALVSMAGNGDGTFAAPQVIPFGPADHGMGNLVVGDFDHDGEEDVVTSVNADRKVLFFKGNGNATFATTPLEAATSWRPNTVAAGDVTGDGEADVVVSYQLDWADHATRPRLGVLAGGGDGTFGPPVDHTYGAWWPGHVAVAELDGQAGLDVAVQHWGYDGNDRGVWMLPNDGNGALGTPLRVYGSASTRTVAAGDYNGDGDTDLLATVGFTDCQDGECAVLLTGNGAGVFAPGPLHAVGKEPNTAPFGASAIDVDGDGDKDFVYVSTSTRMDWVSVGRNRGDGTFDVSHWAGAARPAGDETPEGQSPASAAVADFTGDGTPDVVTTAWEGEGGHPGSLRLLEGDPDRPGDFLAPRAVVDTARHTASERSALGDFDGDGRADVIVQENFGGAFDLLPGDGAGSFGPVRQTVAGTGSACRDEGEVLTADFDGDGHLDLVCARDTSAMVLFGFGDGTLGNPAGLPAEPGLYVSAVSLADFNSDGRPDVVNWNTNSCCAFGENRVGAWRVFLNGVGGPRTFSAAQSFDLGPLDWNSRPYGTAGDFDEDGHPDVVFHTNKTEGSAAPNNERFFFFGGHGDGTFADAVVTQPGLPEFASQLIPADVNEDGHADVVVRYPWRGEIGVLPGNGDGTFGALVHYATGGAVRDLAFVDLNGDGHDDVAAATNQGLAVLTANGDGTFAGYARHPSGRKQTTQVFWTRLGGDTKPDLIVGISGYDGGGGIRFSVLPNATSPYGPRSPDLTVDAVTAPAAGTAGEDVAVHYRVTNTGAPVAGGNWVDTVYLSTDGHWDAADVAIARRTESGPLGADASYVRDVTVPLLAGTRGDHTVIVRSDVRDQVAEGDENDNTALAVAPTDVVVGDVTPGSFRDVTVPAGRDRYLRLDPGATDVIVEAAAAGADLVDLVGRDGKLPLGESFDLAPEQPGDARQRLTVPASMGETYLRIHGRAGAGAGTDVLVSAESVAAGIEEVTPDHGGAGGPATVRIQGAGFGPLARAFLVDGNGNEIAAREAAFESSTAIAATFDLSGAAPGLYGVRVRNLLQTYTAPDAFRVTTAAAGRLETHLSVPGAVRAGFPFDVVLTMRNTGDADMGVPVLHFVSSRARFRLPGGSFVDSPLEVLAGDAREPATILPPGAERRFRVQGLSSTDVAHDTIDLRIDVLGPGDDSPLDWWSRQAALRPVHVPADVWTRVFDTFIERVGPTTGSYVKALGEVARASRGAGSNPVLEADLLRGVVDAVLAEAPKASVAGRIYLDDADHPLGGARLRLLDTDTGSVHEATSVPGGRFAFRGLDAGTYRLLVDGYLPHDLGAVLVPSAGNGPRDLVVTVREGSAVAGRVTRAVGGAPVAGAHVAVVDTAQRAMLSARTGADGTYRVAGVTPGPVRVLVEANGLVPPPAAPGTVPDGGTLTQDFALAGGGTVVGRVLDPGGTPVPGARVNVASGGAGSRSVATGAGGTFSLTGVPPGTHTLRTMKAGFGAGERTGVGIVADEETNVGDVSLTEAGRVTGTVTDTDTGQRLAGANVAVDGLRPGDPVLTDADGRFAMPDVPAGERQVAVSKPGHEPQQYMLTVTPGEDARLQAVLEAQGRIRGHVRRGDGTPVRGIAVVLMGPGTPHATTVTDGTGAFSFTRLANATHTVALWTGFGSRPYVSPREVTLAVGNRDLSLDFTLGFGHLKGTVRRPDGQPAPGADARLERDGIVLDAMTADDQGRYGFLVFGTEAVDVVAFGEEAGFLRREGLSVPEGGTLLDQDLQGSGVGVTIDAGLPGAHVALTAPDGAGMDGATVFAKTGAGGAATFAVIPPGTYRAATRAAGRAPVEDTFAVGAAPVTRTPTLGPGRVVTGTASGPGGPAPGVRISAVDPATGESFTTVADGAGNYTLDSLPDGTSLDVSFADGRRRPVIVTGVVTGALARTVNATLGGSGALVEGTVTDGGGRPVPGLQVAAMDRGGEPLLTTITDVAGRYTLDRLPEADLLVGVETSAAGGAVRRVTPSLAGPTTVDLSVANAGALALPREALASGLRAAINEYEWDGAAVHGYGDTSAGSWVFRSGRLEPPARLGKDTDAWRLRWLDFQNYDPDCPGLLDAANRASNAWYALNRAFEGWQRAHEAAEQVGEAEINLALARAGVLGAKTFLAVANLVNGLVGTKGALERAVQKGQISAENFVALRDALDVLVEWAPKMAEALAQGDWSSYELIANSVVKPIAFGHGGDVIDNWVVELTQLPKGIRPSDVQLFKLRRVLGNVGKAPFHLLGILDAVTDFLEFADQTQQAFDNAISALDLYSQAQSLYLAALQTYDQALNDLQRIESDCPPPPPPPPPLPPPGHRATIMNMASGDPNDVAGPAGVGDRRWIPAGADMAYTVMFENKEDATAPALVVVVTLGLDDDLDPNTFELGDVGFGAVRVAVPQGRQAYETTVDLRPAMPWLVRVQGALDPDTRVVTWTLTTLDPATGDMPTDPTAGFLPPEDGTGRGNGTVAFRVRPRESLPTGTVVAEQARIVFDANAPVDTPEWSNSIDADGPTSAPGALPERVVGPGVRVNWGGSDPGSGIDTYDVLVSEDGGAWRTWLAGTRATEADYPARAGHLYGFTTVARDGVGHVQRDGPARTVRVVAPDPPPGAAPAPLPAKPGAGTAPRCRTVLKRRKGRTIRRRVCRRAKRPAQAKGKGKAKGARKSGGRRSGSRARKG